MEYITYEEELRIENDKNCDAENEVFSVSYLICFIEGS